MKMVFRPTISFNIL